MRFSRTISAYLVGAILPYFVFSWLLLSVILFVQQASRFSDIFFSANIPSSLVWQLTFALVPSVIAFTCPMAALVGVIIGLSKMQDDSELTAIRAAGVGNLQITLPILLIGILLSLFAFVVNLYGVPMAARIVRKVAVQTAIYKLESPIEPGVFNTEVAGFTIYVKDGDIADGQWKNIFIYNEDDKTGDVRLITSASGRIDYTDQLSELVLDNAVASTFNLNRMDKFVSERVGQTRYSVKTRRGDLIEKLAGTEFSAEELGLAQLSEYAAKKAGIERREALILQQRRIILSITPLIFSLLGTTMVLQFHRRGRGFGIFLALISLIAYFFLAFLGEQLARTGRISVFTAGLFPLAGSVFAILWFSPAGRIRLLPRLPPGFSELPLRLRKGRPRKVSRPNYFVDITTGLRDFDIMVNLLKYYLLAVGFLSTVFIIFTAFELWKFAGTMDGGVGLLIQYLIYLLPFIYIQLSPSAAMIATLTTYVIKSRQNEIVTWTSAGQSVYRLLLPCLLFMIVLGAFNWQIQEQISPVTNQIQDDLRVQIRTRGRAPKKPKRFWATDGNRIYSFESGQESDNDKQEGGVGSDGVASDNEKPLDPAEATARNLSVYEFASDSGGLQTLYRIPYGGWRSGKILFSSNAQKLTVSHGRVETSALENGELKAETNPFAVIRSKPSYLNTAETKSQIAATESKFEKRNFEVALQRKYSTILLPLIIALFTAPFALSLSRKGKAVTVGYAVALWLTFLGVTSAFDQFGTNGYLAPATAVWGPLLAFSMMGVYLMSRVKT